MTTYNPRTQRFTVWGAHADYANGSPIMLTSGTVPECRAESNFRRDAGGWTLLTVREGERPSESWLTFAQGVALSGPNENSPRRYDYCDGTCTADCGHCKGKGKPAEVSA